MSDESSKKPSAEQEEGKDKKAQNFYILQALKNAGGQSPAAGRTPGKSQEEKSVSSDPEGGRSEASKRSGDGPESLSGLQTQVSRPTQSEPPKGGTLGAGLSKSSEMIAQVAARAFEKRTKDVEPAGSTLKPRSFPEQGPLRSGNSRAKSAESAERVENASSSQKSPEKTVNRTAPSRQAGSQPAASTQKPGKRKNVSQNSRQSDEALKPHEIRRMREPRTLSIDDLEQKKIIHPGHPDRAAVDHFRQLKNRLLDVSKGKNFTLVVTSAVNNGGASFVAINLAAAFAFDSTRTSLLIDCNLRYPSLHHAFDMIPDLGVTDFLDDPIMDVGSVIYPTGIKRLRFVPAGKRHDATSEYLTSLRMKQLLESVHERYPDRFIILDTPAIGELQDAVILSELTDYTLVVAPHAKVREKTILDACERVAPEKLVGVVLNN